MKHPLFTKLAALAAIGLLLLFGLSMIDNVVRDRVRYRSLTAQSVAESLAGPQTLMGPLIHSACVESWDVETGTDGVGAFRDRQLLRDPDQPLSAFDHEHERLLATSSDPDSGAGTLVGRE